MRPSNIIKFLTTAHKLREPVHLSGPPGGGKTSVAKQAANNIGGGLAFIHAPTANSEDIACPSILEADEWLRWKLDERLPFEGNDRWGDEGIILIDELPQADVAVQKVLGNLLLERSVHGHKIKDGWSFVSTGNRQQDRAGANRMLSQVMGRLTEIEFETDLNDLCNWGWDTGRLTPEVISFLRFKPDQAHDFDPNRSHNPTPRGWEKVSNYTDNIAADEELEVFRGVVGEGAATEYISFLKICRKLPNPDVVLMTPDKADVPVENSVRYALCGALAQRASEDNFDAVLTYARRMPGDFTVLTILDSIRKCPEVQNTRAFTDWAIKDGAKILI